MFVVTGSPQLNVFCLASWDPVEIKNGLFCDLPLYISGSGCLSYQCTHLCSAISWLNQWNGSLQIHSAGELLKLPEILFTRTSVTKRSLPAIVLKVCRKKSFKNVLIEKVRVLSTKQCTFLPL